MNTSRLALACGLALAFLSPPVSATERFVSPAGGHVPPFTTWTDAATNIQNAIDAGADGDVIWVTNGVYATGGKVMAGDLTNRVALDKALTVQSVNGPFVTTIQGAGATNGVLAVRCAWLTNGATLMGFTLQGGATRLTGTLATLQSGGGVWCASSNSLVANCVMKSNSAVFGGGAYQGSLKSCLLIGNKATYGGGSYDGVLNSCTIVSNSNFGIYAGPLNQAKLTNCIVYFNTSLNSIANYQGGTFSYSCSDPQPAGPGNIKADPRFYEDGIHITKNSRCRFAGTNLVSGTDIDVQPWANPPSIGCDEWQPAPVVIIQPAIQLTSDPRGFTLGVTVAGQEPFTCWWTRDGVPIEDDGHYSSAHTTRLVANEIVESDAGYYRVVVSNAFGVVTSALARVEIQFVNPASAYPMPPYTNWNRAARDIQHAINQASPGAIVLVTNGVYAGGGKAMAGDLFNRVALDKPLLVKSVNGPFVTIIQGLGAINGPNAMRCAWLTDGAGLIGFTLQGGATRTIGDAFTLRSGGGAWCASSNALIASCVIKSNSASYAGGGAFRGRLNNCFVSGNSSPAPPGQGGGGACNATLSSCTVVCNSGYGIYFQTGLDVGTVTNCIVYYNTPGNASGLPALFGYCCIMGTFPGNGNISAAPQLFVDGIHLTSGSPCRGAGTNLTSGADIFGRPWSNPPSIGCAEWQPAPLIGNQPKLQLTSRPVGFTISAMPVTGQEPLTYRWMKDGVLLGDDDHYRGTDTTNLIAAGIIASDAGNYRIVVSNAFGVVTSAVAPLVIHYVSPDGNSSPPYLDWPTAATNIQDAIDAAAPGEIVLVTNGAYATGGKAMAGDLTNRVALDKTLTVVSVNGAAGTVIQGAWDPATTNGPLAVRCAWLTDGAILSGFTLRNGATRSTGASTTLQSGGGVWCASTNALVANCWLSDNAASLEGGGAYQGLINNCVLTNNSAVYGGGASSGILNNCVVILNGALNRGGGAYFATLNNCTVTFNYTCFTCGSFSGAGTYSGTTRNSIVLYNSTGRYGGSYANYESGATQYSYCCTSPSAPGYPMPGGVGNINAFNVNPQRLDWFHIATTSPCRGAGSPLYATGTDLDGETWANPPSIGCDEVVEANLVGPLTVAILAPQTKVLVNHFASFGAQITGRIARVEWSFGDGSPVTFSSSHIWTNVGDYTLTLTAFNTDNPGGVSTNLLVHVLPPNPPLLQLATITANGFQFEFPGQESVQYWVEMATNLTPPINWQTLQTIFYSTGGVHQITDSTPTNATRFYRVKAR